MSFTPGAGTRFVVTSTTNPSGGITPPGPILGPLTFTAGTATTNTPAFDITQTWNNAAVTFTGFRFNVTDTASNANSLLMDLQVGGVSRFAVEKGLSTTRFTVAPNSADANFGVGLLAGTKQGGVVLTRNGFIGYRGTGINQVFEVNGAAGVFIASDYVLAWSSTGGTENSKDLFILRDAANTLAQRNGLNAQTFRLYNTFTDASNYERLSVDWSSNVAYMRPQNAGTGSARIFVPVTGATTVAALPSAATAGAGARAFVTDASATTFASVVAGGGANAVPVVSNGTNWIIG